ncbi:MAG: NUDIX domain-containing protein [Thermoguttaceae bacterium]|nr:NUDIX domain-containing protein [Thermoguttaceae bacterium]MDW8079467.1 NUDIX domain-containing protein [Thermoguttaceae bacterium]
MHKVTAMRSGWEKLDGRVVADHTIFRVRHDLYRRHSDGLTHEFVVVECPDWVNIVALTCDERVILVRQFRHGLDKATWEIPGGVLEPGESPQAGALRELREETGHLPQRIEPIGIIHPNPAYQMNTCHVFLATGCTLVGDQHLDPTEEVELGFFPLEEVLKMVSRGEITHSLVLAALLHLLLYRSHPATLAAISPSAKA